MVFPVVMYRYELDNKEGWVLKNWCFWTIGLEKTLESRLDYKEIKPANPKGNQPWIFLERTDAEAEAPILWPSNVKSWLIGKDPDAGKDWGQEGKGVTEDEMVGWHHQLNGHKFEQSQGDSEGQRSLAGSMESQRVRQDWERLIRNCLGIRPVSPALEGNSQPLDHRRSPYLSTHFFHMHILQKNKNYTYCFVMCIFLLW